MIGNGKTIVSALVWLVLASGNASAQEAKALSESEFQANQANGVYSFQIRVFTANDERVSVGPNKNEILRWGRDNAYQEQEWIFIPDGDRFQILSNKRDLEDHYIGLSGPMISLDGNAGVWFFYMLPKQGSRFKLEWLGSDRTHLRLIEDSKNEYFTGHNFGFNKWLFSRWGNMPGRDVAGGAKAQVYQLVSPRRLQVSTIALNPLDVIHKPGEIGPPPALAQQYLDNQQSYPKKTDPIAVGQKVVSALPMGLLGYSTKHAQIEGSPYYKITHFQYWDRTEATSKDQASRGGLHRHFKGKSSTKLIRTAIGISKTDYTTFTESFEIGADLGAEFLSSTLGLSAKASWARETGTSETNSREREVVDMQEIPAETPDTLYADWSLVDRWEIVDSFGVQQASFEAVSEVVPLRYPALEKR